MENAQNIEKVREFFKNDRFATTNGAVIEEVGEKSAKCTLEIKENHLNAMGALMGGVPFMLADFAFAVASNWEKAGTVSLSTNITFLGVAKGKKLFAEATCVKDGRTTCYYRVDITDDLGTQVAAATVTGYHKA